MQFPLMAPVEQHFPSTSLDDVEASVRDQLRAADLKSAIAPGARIAITAGSRGIANVAAIERMVVDQVKEAGGHPFILPAMGSHGGSTPEG